MSAPTAVIVADTRIETSDGWKIMLGRIGAGRPVEEWRALARLLAASWEMRRTLVLLGEAIEQHLDVTSIDTMNHLTEVLRHNRALLARIDGGQP